jgi:general secretion pathway protein B
MSYILDALRKAEAERERGTVPHLMAQPLGSPPTAAAPRRGALWGAGAALSLAAAVGAGWWLARQDAPAPSAVPAAAMAPAVPVTEPVAVHAAAPATGGTALSTAPNTVATPPARTAPVVNSGTPGSLAALEQPPGPQRPAVGVPAAAPAPQAVDGAPASATTRPTPTRTVAYDQLPPDVRRQLPALSLAGAIYSDTPSARMLLVNGQLQREGDHVAPGVVLEQILPRSAVLRWRDLRYEMGW